MKSYINKIHAVIRILVGLVFIFSGYVKAIDPLGSAYKFSEYFMAIHLPAMDEFALICSIMLSSAEFIIGIALVLGLLMNITSWVALIFMSFFTLLTFLLAIFNPISDCGCFGDAIKLSNWETFYKNLVFLAMVLFLFIYRKISQPLFNRISEFSIVALSGIFIICISLYSYRHLPLIDFIAYRVGNNIIEQSTIPPGAPTDEYETRLIYKNKNTGELKEFDMNNYPWQDTINWQWIDTKSILIKKGYTPRITNFSINNLDGHNITDSILHSSKYIFLAVIYKIEKANEKGLKYLDTLAQYCSASNDKLFFAVTASSFDKINQIKEKLELTYNFAHADETLLKTMIRSNPGILLLYRGTILGKWHYNDFHFNYNIDNILKTLTASYYTKIEFLVNYSIAISLILFIIAFLFFIKTKSCK